VGDAGTAQSAGVSPRRIGVVLLVAAGLGCLAAAGWIEVKAVAAQALIDAAWLRAERGAPNPRPWPWADTRPVGRLFVGVHGPLVILEGSNGRNLAFGPTHDPASVQPGERGNAIISAHRDTHFQLLQRVVLGEQVRIELPGGARVDYRVTDARVVDSRRMRISLDAAVPMLTLVTCYPFNAVDPGGPLRYVVSAEQI